MTKIGKQHRGHSRSHSQHWGQTRLAAVNLDLDEEELFQKIAEGVQVFEGGGSFGQEEIYRYLELESEKIPELFDQKLAIIQEAGYQFTPPGGELPLKKCFRIFERRTFTKKELDEAQFLNVFVNFRRFIANGGTIDSATGYCEFFDDDKLRRGRSQLGALDSTSVLLGTETFFQGASEQQFSGLQFFEPQYRVRGNQELIPPARIKRRLFALSSTKILPTTLLTHFNATEGSRRYSPEADMNLFEQGTPPKLVYSADHASEFDHDVMLTEEIVGRGPHHRYLVFCQRFYQFMKSFRPIDFHYSPIFMK